ncbi:YcaO-like family protein [Streptomyces sp. ISL-43]|uniref:YcaO-like family protein n=1 Tax=Streptomyces sp. ISL-43 TaxID=2819183 RepID=UPI001BEAEAF9|nr:YcaO-like family protein [Streptomyces sp. ISL-43]MBT2445600.1 YcaO-like family protein [Streptomyces sp. ISL-43]
MTSGALQAGLGRLKDLDALVGPYGLVERTHRLPNQHGDARFPISTASLGNLTPVVPNVAHSVGGRDVRGEMDGAGGAPDPQRAALLSVAEALERYSMCVVRPEEIIWATAQELGSQALDLESFPRCSPAELDHPKALTVDVDTRAPMRWVRGWSLTRREPKWVPAVQVWMHIPPQSVGERGWNPISTGCATHTDLAQALINGLCEVVERDAIALTWYQRLALPRIDFDEVPAALEPFLKKSRDSLVDTVFFDATTDLGIPTVYSVDLSPHNEVLGQMVMCNTSLDPADSVAKIIRESASSRIAMQVNRPMPDSVDDFQHVFHGASYMGSPDRLGDFDFLLKGEARTPFSELPHLSSGDSGQDLALLVDMLARAGYEAVAVDCTTDEARDVGFRVVRVLVPGLMPLSFTHRARYLAHPRLYEAPARMGYPVHAEPDLNPLPQPFA